MDNDEQRDYAEEAYNRWLMRGGDEEPDLCMGCAGLGCNACQQTGYAGGREP